MNGSGGGWPDAMSSRLRASTNTCSLPASPENLSCSERQKEHESRVLADVFLSRSLSAHWRTVRPPRRSVERSMADQSAKYLRSCRAKASCWRRPSTRLRFAALVFESIALFKKR